MNGGFDLAAEWMGWENKFHCEWNPFGQKVLHHYWPNAEQFTDITKTDFTKYEGTIDIISGGFPCQPYSSAGKRLGKEDERHLWPEMLRAIREIQPRWVVGENVRGLINWGGWYSTRCKLTWKLKGTKLSRFYFQLAPSTLHTEGIEYGLLPTPTASDSNAGRRGNAPRQGHNPMTNSLKDAVNYLEETLKCSHLNPLFVEEMMGFPKNWTTLPFLNGAMNQSKHTETQ